MSYKPRDGREGNGSRPTAKRSPSILVTDSRTNGLQGTRAPFAGQNFKKQQQQLLLAQQRQPHCSGHAPGPHSSSLHKKLAQRYNKFTDISVDKLLSNSSDIPLGQSRLPGTLSGRGPPLAPMGSPPPRDLFPGNSAGELLYRRTVRSIPKLSQLLPLRTSKTSQKLVLIPEQQRYGSSSPPLPPAHSIAPDLPAQVQRSRAELMPKEARAHEFPRTTAYFICEEFNLEAVAAFLAEYHEVRPRLYDEALYVPYALPLLPGADGFRVKSNDLAKLLSSKRYMEKLINKNEQTDHLYEYYSGVETPEDANNYLMDPENENNDAPFDPSEPQFFAPPMEDAAEVSDDSEGSSKLLADGPDGKSKPRPPSPTPLTLEIQADFLKNHAEMFVFMYGIVVFWNFLEVHEKNILADLAFASDKPEPLLINPIDEQDIETEEFHFEYDNQIHRPRIYNDMITLRLEDHLIKLTMLHALAQLTKLCLFESRMVHSLQLISRLPRKLALTGQLGLKRQQLIKRSGRLFKLRVDVNLLSLILDTPEFFWSLEPALHPLYLAVREYLEIEQRVQVLNDRCKVFLEFSDIVSDSMNERNTNRITFMIIVIIFLSLAVSVFELALQLV